MNCINCKSEKVLAVVNYKDKLDYNQSINYNYCINCLYFPLSVRWRAIYSTDLPIELKLKIFKRYMTLIT